MELNAYYLALVAGGFGIAGTLIGVFCTYHLSIKLADRQFEHMRAIARLDAWNAAVREFRNALGGELAVLESNSDDLGDVMDYLRRSYTSHAAAVTVFAEYLPCERRKGLHAAWLHHCYDGEDPSEVESLQSSGLGHDRLLFLHYSNESYLPSPPSARSKAINGIRALLAFANDA